MATVKISELPAMTTISNSDILPIVDTSETETKKVTKEMLLSDIDASQLDLSNMTEATQINDSDYLIINQNGETKKISKSNSQFASGDEIAISTTTPVDPDNELKLWVNPDEIITPSKIYVDNEYSDATDKSYSCDYINGLELGGGGYSTTEHDTGKKWLNDKEIYKKVIVENEEKTGMQTIALGMSCDEIIGATLISNRTSNGSIQMIEYGTSIGLQRGSSTSAIQFSIPSGTTFYGYKVIIEYTKQ